MKECDILRVKAYSNPLLHIFRGVGSPNPSTIYASAPHPYSPHLWQVDVVGLLAWTTEGPGFESWFGQLSRVGQL